MKTKSKFAGFLGAIAGLFKSPFQRAYDKKRTSPVNNRPRLRLGADPYPSHRHKSKDEKARIAAFHEQRRKRVVTVGTNHDRVVKGRAAKEGISVDEYKLKYQK